HFGCTSEDINNLSYALSLKEFGDSEFYPVLDELIAVLKNMAKKYTGFAMLSHTHGQPASPTTVGKEFMNVVARLERQNRLLRNQEVLGKMNGATGNFNAHTIAYPNIDWVKKSEKFVKSLGLVPNPYTTQIEPHDFIAEICDAVRRVNTILIDFDRDMWMYISMNYFAQKVVKGEVGSSAMPHKVNPIYFENSEGNLGVANALFGHFSEKLPISRMQRDLTDSTVLRNLGYTFALTILAYKSTLTALERVELNKKVVQQDLDNNWEVLAEAVQTVLRKNKVKGAYEKLKEFTRGQKINAEGYKKFVASLDLLKEDKKRLMELTPEKYIGKA
ncbi:MAG: adenylosuccinate lyase, partial [Candidatus Gracilibacteria bacterium]